MAKIDGLCPCNNESANMSEPWSAAGCFKDMSDMGFTDLDCVRETGIENQLDAKATKIQIHLQLNPPRIIFADNASGMDKDQLKASRRLFNRKDAHDDKNGCFGIGGSVGSSQLTRLSGKATRLSKIQGKDILQLTLNYPTIIEEDKYETCTHDATKGMSDIWDTFAIDKDHGTLDILECPSSVVEDMIKTLPTTARLGRMYADYLTEGTNISLHINGKVTNILPEDVSDEANATKVEKYVVRVWIKDSTSEVIAQFKNASNDWVFMEGKKLKHYIEDPESKGFTMVGEINCTSSIRYKKGGENNWKSEDGGQYFKRVKKIIERFEIPFPSSGDFPERDIIASARHVWNFPTILDKLMGVEINKSRINNSNIPLAISNTLEKLGNDFSKKLWKVLKAAEPQAPRPVVPLPVVPQAPRPVVPRPVVPQAPQPVVPQPPQPKPQSQKDLVISMKNVKDKLNSLDLDSMLANASNVMDASIASKILVLQDMFNLLEKI